MVPGPIGEVVFEVVVFCGFSDDFEGGAWVAGEDGEDFDGAFCIEDGFDKGLGDGDGAVEGADVAPGFEVMRRRNMPCAELCGFVFVESCVDGGFVAEDVGKVEVGRGGEDGVGVEEEDCVGVFCSLCEGDELFVVGGPGLFGAGVFGVGVVVDGCVVGGVDGGDGGVDVWGLALSGDEDGFMRCDVVEEFLEECRYVFWER